MHEQTIRDDHITLTEATKVAPGRPSTNCLWRWCRRGVKARDGQRVRLQHIRIGGKIFTTLAWLAEFGRQLADADTKYFDLCEATAQASVASDLPFQRRRQSPRHEYPPSARTQDDLDDAERELAEEGL